MKLILDTCIWGGAAEELRAAGHDVVWSGDWENDLGDEEIIAIAHEQGRTLVTLDKDFGELAIVFRRPHSGILRLVGLYVNQQALACRKVLNIHGSELESGSIVTAEQGRIRIRRSK